MIVVLIFLFFFFFLFSTNSRDECQSMGTGSPRLPASDEEDGLAAHRRQPEIPAQRSALRAPHHRSHVQDCRRPRSGQLFYLLSFFFFLLLLLLFLQLFSTTLSGPLIPYSAYRSLLCRLRLAITRTRLLLGYIASRIAKEKTRNP